MNSQQAAAARAAGTRARADRPRERRSAAGGAPLTPGRLREVSVRTQTRAAGGAAGETLTFSGCASVYEQPYEMWDFFGGYNEVVSAGAATATLAASPDVAFLLNHGGMTLARTTSGTLQLSQDESGLQVLADLDPANSIVADLASAMRRGDMSEMSFAFSITSGLWSPDYTEFRIDAFDLNRGDVSAVNYGANPFTTSELRSADGVLDALAHLDPDTLHRAQQALDARRSALGLLSPAEQEAIFALVRS